MTRHWRAALAMTLLLAAACNEQAKAPNPTADQSVVTRVALRSGDLPAGWTAVAHDASDHLLQPIHGCLEPQGWAPTATRTSDRYALGLLNSVFAEVLAWPSAGVAQSSLSAMASDSFDSCATAAIQGYLTSVGTKLVSSEHVTVPVPPRGDSAWRYARTFVIQGADGKRSEVSLDVLRVRRDRLTITCVQLGAAAPLTDVTGRDFVDLMLNRVAG